ncbi:hypothetical protein GCM10028833_30240 [Glycomyces tarimensis]
MDYTERGDVFRRHATAMFRGDRAEAHSLQRLIYPEHFGAHQLFIHSLFAAAAQEHFGDELDWDALEEFMARFRDERPGISPLKTEALIRSLYGESRLFLEVPQVDHWPSMWATAQILVGAYRTNDELAGLYDIAEEAGRATVVDVFESNSMFGSLRPEAGEP